jgi:hypothetical protein
MALGSYNNNGEKEKDQYRPTVYGYSMSNTESEIDVTNLSHSMWKGTLKLAISPKIETANKDENIKWDTKAAATIYLNHSKARIFAETLKGFVKDPEAFNQRGTWAGQGLITVSTGEEFGKTAPCLIIRKIGESGQVESSYAYEFKRNYHCAIEKFDEKTGDFSSDYDSFQNLEILQVITMLENYYNAMTGAVAFSVVDNLSFSQNRTNESLAKIASGVGVELYAQKSSKSGGSSYFANKGAGANKSSSSTISEIMDED